MLKRLRTEGSSSSELPQAELPGYNSKGKARSATVEDVTEDDGATQEENFAPGNDPDYYAEEDEEGRFFGGGLTEEQKEILNVFDGTGREDVANEDVCVHWRSICESEPADSFLQLEELNITGIRRMLLKFERAAKKNQDQRSKFSDDPTK